MSAAPKNPDQGIHVQFPDPADNPQKRRAQYRMTQLIEAAIGFGLEQPVIFNGQDPEAGELTAIWQYGTSRITVYQENDAFEVELVPGGPAVPFATSTPEAAAAYIAGVRTHVV